MAANPYTTNLELQLDVRTIVGLSDGDAVTTATDSSAAGNDVTQSNATYKPVYKTNIIGTNPVIRFSGASNKSLYATFAGSWSGYGGTTVFMLAQWIENTAVDFGSYIVMHGGSGDDFNNANNLVMHCGVGSGSATFSRSTISFTNVNDPLNTPIACLRVGQPTLCGFALQQGSNGFKTISEYGDYDTGSARQISGTPTGLVIGNRYLSGAISTTGGARFDLAMMLVYKEYMSDTNIALVKNWMLTEFDLHTQAAGGGGVADLFGGLVK